MFDEVEKNQEFKKVLQRPLSMLELSGFPQDLRQETQVAAV